jgi:regulator of RNase E activity RraA
LHPPPAPVEPELVAQLGRLSSALLSDQMNRSGGLAALLPVPELRERVVVGRAFTVRTRPGDNLVVHKAADLVEPGDFLVIDAGGAVDNAIIGEIWCRYVASRGVIAVALDGAVRDVHTLRSMAMPVFARGVTHQGPFKDGPGELRGPIAIGNTVVMSGDYVVGDADGVVVIPAGDVRSVLTAAQVRLDKERRMLEDISNGTLERGWLGELEITEAP